MRVRSLLIILALMLATPVQANPRHPTGRWIVNFDAAQCAAQRTYGPADNPVHLIIKQPPVGDVLQIAAIQDRGGGPVRQREGSIAFDDLPPKKMNLLVFEATPLGKRTSLFNVPTKDLTAFPTAKSIRLEAPGLSEELTLSGVDRLMAVMKACVDDLRKVWNIGSDGLSAASGTSAAEGNVQGLLNSTDYPSVALQNMHSGTVTITMLIDEQGKVADCTLTSTSEFASLDGQTCAILRKRAKFKPGRDAQGKAIKSSFSQRITWRVE